jgi:peptidyl-prolyl cis-trans isomerase D
MAVLERLRKRMGILLAVVIGLALFGFVLQDVLTSGGSGRKQLELAVIDGKSVSYQVYQRKIDELLEIYRIAGNTTIDEATQQSVREQTWQQLVRELVLEDEYKKLGVAVSSDELFNLVQGPNPHPTVRQIFTDPESGIFNRTALISFLRNKDQDPTGNQLAYWLFLENEIYNERRFNKYNNLIRKGLYVTGLQATNDHTEKGLKTDFRFLMKRYIAIPDSLVTFTNGDVERYYKNHQNDFKQTAARSIEYVSFDVRPSATDIEETERWINNIKSDFEKEEAVEQFINLNSDEAYDRSNYKDGELPETINDFMFGAEVGDVYGPYFENDAYKLAKLVAINYLPDSVKARHILIQPDQNQPIEVASNLTDSIMGLINAGADFAALANEFSVDPGSNQLGGNLGWFTEGTMVQEFNDACFNGKTGDVVRVETQFGFHIIEIQDQGPTVKKVNVGIIVRELAPSSQTFQNIYSEASRFAGMNNTYEKFIDAIEKEGLNKRIASDLQENATSIPGLETPRALIRSAFQAKEGNIILDFSNQAVFEIGDRFVIAYLTEVKEEGVAPLDQVRAEVELNVRKEMKAGLIAEELRSAMTPGISMDELAGNLDLQVEEATNISFSSFSVPTAGIEPAVIAAVVTLPQNQLSPPITGNNAVYIVEVTSIAEPDELDLAAARMRLFTSYQARANFEAFEALKEGANIEDKRSKFY